MKKFMDWRLAVSILACEAVGASGSLFTAPAIPEWYANLVKPDLAPPNWIFAPVWTVLFALMGVALFLVWREKTSLKKVRAALFAFFLQFLLNIAWSAIFFGLRFPGWAFAEIIFLLAAIILTIVLFRRVSRAAAWLLVPYLAWVGFASYLNLMIWRLN